MQCVVRLAPFTGLVVCLVTGALATAAPKNAAGGPEVLQQAVAILKSVKDDRSAQAAGNKLEKLMPKMQAYQYQLMASLRGRAKKGKAVPVSTEEQKLFEAYGEELARIAKNKTWFRHIILGMQRGIFPPGHPARPKR